MNALVRGRVVDAAGAPVAGATVYLEHPLPPREPFVATTGADGEYAFTDAAHPDLREALRSQRRIADLRLLDKRPPALHAVAGDRASPKAALEGDQVAPDLVVAPGITARVVVRRADGAPAAGVPIHLFLQDLEPVDERVPFTTAVDVTDAQGTLAVGPVPDHEYSVLLEVLARDAPIHQQSWESRRLRDPVEVTLAPGRTVRGVVLTAEGRPAAGYGVVSEPQFGPRRVTITDAAGRFDVAGVAVDAGRIGVHDRPSELGSLLLVHDVPAGTDDVGEVRLPKLGTFEVRLEDEQGRALEASRGRTCRAHDRLGRWAPRADADGVLRVERMPLGEPVELHVRFRDARHGELEQRFVVDATGKPQTLTATGAGTVVVRLQPRDVAGARARWSEGRELDFAVFEPIRRGEPVSELRGWAPPGLRDRLTIRADGYEECVLACVEVRADGPTLLDAALTPRG